MGKYDGILICTDLDGTFSDKAGIISKENADAIRYFMANGGKFTLATGRSAPFFMGDDTVFTRSGLEFLPNVPVVTHNGASVYDYKKMEYIYTVPLPGDDIEREILEKACDDDRVSYVFLSGIEGENVNVTRKDRYENFKESVMENYYRLKDSWFKIVFCFYEEKDAINMRDELIELFEIYGKYSVNRTWSTGVEVLKDNATKGVAVRWLKNYLGGIDKVVCVGDFENDISMIIEADLGVAVANAADDLKACADMITVSNGEHALAKVIESLDSYFNLDA